MFITKVWILFLYLKPTESYLEKQIPTYTSVENASHPYLYKIQLKCRNDFLSGYLCSNHTTTKMAIGPTHGLNVLINCKFAFWTISKIQELIKSSPLFYPNQFDFYEHTDTEHNEEFEKNLENFLNFVHKTIAEYSIFIYNILYFTSEVRVHNIAFTLKSMFTLLIKSHYIFSFKKGDINTRHISNTEILRLIQLEMIELQRFYLMHCEEVPENNNENAQLLYGLLVPINVHKIVIENDVNSMFRILNNSLHLHSIFENACKVSDLLKVVRLSSDIIVFREIADVQVKVTSEVYVSIRDIMNQIETNYDLNVLYWFYETIWITIVKLVVQKILYILTLGTDIKYLKNDIAKVYNYTSIHGVPLYIKKAFNILRNLYNDHRVTNTGSMNSNVNTQLKKYFDDLNSDGFKTFLIEIKLPDGGDFQMKKSQYSESVTVLLKFIANNIDNFECINYYFKPVKNAYCNYFKPFANSKTFLIPKSSIEKSNTTCDFITKIYFLCIQASTFLNKFVKNISDKINGTVSITGLEKTLLKIKNVFLLLVKKRTDDVEILILAYDVSAILVNYKLDRENVYFHVKSQRIINVILNEMNKYKIKNCAHANLSLLTFGNTYLNEIYNTNSINGSIEYYFKNYVSNFNFGDLIFETSINDNDWQFLSIDYIYRTFVEKSNVFSPYEEKIKIIWNGSVQSLNEIFNNESAIVFDPLIVYFLYEVYFKYCAAIIFFRIKEVLLTNNLNKIDKNVESMKNTLNVHWKSFFPLAMRYILDDIENNFLHVSYKYVDSTKGLISEIEKIEEKFKTLNIVYENSVLRSIESKSCFNFQQCNKSYQMMSAEKFGIILKKLLENLMTVYKYYLKITQQRPNVHNDNDKTNDTNDCELCDGT